MADTSTDPKLNKEYHNTATAEPTATGVNGQNLTPEQRARYDYGGNPLAHLNTGDSARFPAFGGEFQPGLYKPTTERKFANPAPLGLSAFALTTFVLSLINIGVRGVKEGNIIVSLAFGYGGLVQLLAGMWYVLFLGPLWVFYVQVTNPRSTGKWPWETLSVLLLSHLMVVSGSALRSFSPLVDSISPPLIQEQALTRMI